jgi:hypothetical protein
MTASDPIAVALERVNKAARARRRSESAYLAAIGAAAAAGASQSAIAAAVGTSQQNVQRILKRQG